MIKIIANLYYVTHVGGLQLFLKMYLKLINVLGVKKENVCSKNNKIKNCYNNRLLKFI